MDNASENPLSFCVYDLFLNLNTIKFIKNKKSETKKISLEKLQAYASSVPQNTPRVIAMIYL